MAHSSEGLFESQDWLKKFVHALQTYIRLHHRVYPTLAPQGIYFEYLVEQALLRAGWSRKEVIPAKNPNAPEADIQVGGWRLSLKTETGAGTQRDMINITKLCTTETGIWKAEELIRYALSHLSRYQGILMLRGIRGDRAIDYQLIYIPSELIKRMRGCPLKEVGRRQGRKSLAGKVQEKDRVLFHIHFDGADGKCQIQRLRRDSCHTLAEWSQPLGE
jgi:hypothetical protein